MASFDRNQQLVAAGVVGGFLTTFLGYGLCKLAIQKKKSCCSKEATPTPGSASCCKSTVTTMTSERIPAPIGPYRAGKIFKSCGATYAWTCGQIGVAPEDGKKLVSDDVVVQAKQALTNLKSLLEDNGFSLNDVVKMNVYLTDMADFAEVNKVYTDFFQGDNPPARTCVAVAGLPLGASFECESVLFKWA